MFWRSRSIIENIFQASNTTANTYLTNNAVVLENAEENRDRLPSINKKIIFTYEISFLEWPILVVVEDIKFTKSIVFEKSLQRYVINEMINKVIN